jgi:hypothetical protein
LAGWEEISSVGRHSRRSSPCASSFHFPLVVKSFSLWDFLVSNPPTTLRSPEQRLRTRKFVHEEIEEIWFKNYISNESSFIQLSIKILNKTITFYSMTLWVIFYGWSLLSLAH